MISAVGIVGNVENLGLEGTKVKVEKTHIVIDQWGFTGEPNVYAIGDVAGPPWLAHKAMHEGVLVVEKIAGVKGVHPMKTENIPGCTYCQPQVAEHRPHRGGGQGQGPAGQGRQVPLHRQRQGDRARRARGLHQDGVRRQDRRACWAPT